jgi:spore germination protein PF
MPSIIGALNIGTLDHSAMANFSESLILCPKSTARSSSGSFAGPTAFFMQNFSGFNATNSSDPHISDENISTI